MTQAVDTTLDITTHTISLGMRVTELPMIGSGIIAMVATPERETIATFVGPIILFAGELEMTSDAGDFPTKQGFEILKHHVGLGSGHPTLR